MTDLVERLRFTASAGIPDFTNSKLLDEAADEIERLRGLLAWHDSTVPEILADNTRLRAKLAEMDVTSIG